MLDSVWTGGPVLCVTSSLTERSWHWRAAEDRLGFAISQRLGVPDIVGRVLAARDVSLDDAADFLAPTLRALLPDPALLRDMPAAASRLADAVRRQECVAVFGDYDVDGACSAALLTLLLRELGCTVLPYIPDRFAEGYGPNAPALETLAARGATLVVCVDCGTSAHQALSALRGRADTIVLDHHKAEGLPPEILATVNPNRLDDRSGLQNLCAAGVAFMTAIALLRALRAQSFFAARPEPDLMGFLDLVALATVCDVMPLTGLNRALVAQGLRVMGRRGRPGLAALMDVAQTRDAPSAMTCGFGLGPRINAGGRISEADLGLRLLLCADALDARALAERLDAANRQRQSVEAGVLAAAMEAADAQIARGDHVLLVCGAWHAGVVGIVAGRIKEKYNRPVCVGAVADGVIKGSGRSIAGLDLGSAVIAARQSGLLLTGGGHAMAAGFSLLPAQADAFQAFLNARLPRIEGAPHRPHLRVEATTSPSGATVELAQHLAKLAPFGAGNDEPVLVVPDIRVVKCDRLGNDGNTLRAFVQSEGDTRRLKTLLFRAGDGALAQAMTERPGARLHLAGHLRAETWNGSTSASFCLIDGAVAQE
jgi:single-stranded-DNA-specific exonuclease